jgi:hypothetical protein
VICYEDAIRLGMFYDNDKWQSATKLEMGGLHECDVFHDKGIGTTPGEQFKKIRVLHLVPHTNGEHESLPHVILTSDADLDPRVLDFDIGDDDD